MEREFNQQLGDLARERNRTLEEMQIELGRNTRQGAGRMPGARLTRMPGRTRRRWRHCRLKPMRGLSRRRLQKNKAIIALQEELAEQGIYLTPEEINEVLDQYQDGWDSVQEMYDAFNEEMLTAHQSAKKARVDIAEKEAVEILGKLRAGGKLTEFEAKKIQDALDTLATEHKSTRVQTIADELSDINQKIIDGKPLTEREYKKYQDGLDEIALLGQGDRVGYAYNEMVNDCPKDY